MVKIRQLSIAEHMFLLDKMDFYDRNSGYIGETSDGKLELFDSMPSFGGAFVTRRILRDSLKIKLAEK